MLCHRRAKPGIPQRGQDLWYIATDWGRGAQQTLVLSLSGGRMSKAKVLARGRPSLRLPAADGCGPPSTCLGLRLLTTPVSACLYTAASSPERLCLSPSYKATGHWM